MKTQKLNEKEFAEEEANLEYQHDNNGCVVNDVAVRIAAEKKYPKNKYKKFDKVVKLTQDGLFIATYNDCYGAGKTNGIRARKIYKCCTGKKGSTGGFRWMFQDDYHAKRTKVSYWEVKKTSINKIIR